MAKTKTSTAVASTVKAENATPVTAKKSLKDRNAIVRSRVHDAMVDFLMENIATVKNNGFFKIDGDMYEQYAPVNPLTGKKYSSKNFALLFCIAIAKKDPRFSTFLQLKHDAKKVKKGAHGHEAVSCVPLVKDEETHKLRPAQTEEEYQNLDAMGLKGFTVFNYSDIEAFDGAEPVEPFKPAIVKHVDHYEDIDLMVKNYGIKINFDDQDGLKGDVYGCYYPLNHTISIYAPEAFKSASDYYSVLLHEIAHSTGNALNRPVCNKKNTALYNREELVAEISSFLLALHFKVPYDLQRLTSVFAYLKHYANNQPKMRREKIDWALTEAEKVINYLRQFEGKKSDQSHEEIEEIAINTTNEIKAQKVEPVAPVEPVQPVQTDLFTEEPEQVEQPKKKVASKKCAASSALKAMSKKASKKKAPTENDDLIKKIMELTPEQRELIKSLLG